MTVSFTSVELTGQFQTAQQEPATGELTFTLTQAMGNSDIVIAPAPLTVALNTEGKITVTLPANDDTGTSPQGVRYGVTEKIVGAQPRDYFILISHTAASGQVDLSTLMPGEPGWI